MVGAKYLGVDGSSRELWAQAVGDKEIVYAPSCVFLSCLKAV